MKTGIIWALSLVVTAMATCFLSSRLPGGASGLAGDPALRSQLLVADMRANLARAAELEKCAILSKRDEEAAGFADEFRTASGTVDRNLGRLRKLVDAQGSARQREQLERFETSWKELKQIDTGLLVSSAQNTDVKAVELSGTIGAELLQKFHDDLSRAAQKTAPPSRRSEADRLAGQAENAMLNLALLQMRHIHAPTAADKEALEKPMDESRKKAESMLKSMQAVAGRKGNPFLGDAETVLGEFMQLHEEIVRLSKIDSNTASTERSLGKRRAADIKCDRLLKELQKPGS